MKTHLSFSSKNLAKSIEFYSILLDSAPTKSYDDYALFVSADPGLELALNSGTDRLSGQAVHYGIAVDSPEAVDAAISRLEAAGLPVDVEREEICCYAKQSKVWTTDPDGRRWETYYIIQDTAQRSGENLQCCQTPLKQTAATKCC